VPESDGALRDPGELAGHIEVAHVNFRYGPDAPLVLRHVSMRIQVLRKPGVWDVGFAARFYREGPQLAEDVENADELACGSPRCSVAVG